MLSVTAARAITPCRQAGFTEVRPRGDTDFSLTAEFDRWDADGVRFVFGYDARANLIKTAQSTEEEIYHELATCAERQIATTPRTRPRNVKDEILRERNYKVLRQAAEDVVGFSCRPGNCKRDRRVVALRKNISVQRGENVLFSETASARPSATQPRRSPELQQTPVCLESSALSDRVLDAGTGIGGTARLIAAERGPRVTAVALTADYWEVAKWRITRSGSAGHRRGLHQSCPRCMLPVWHIDHAEFPGAQRPGNGEPTRGRQAPRGESPATAGVALSSARARQLTP